MNGLLVRAMALLLTATLAAAGTEPALVFTEDLNVFTSAERVAFACSGSETTPLRVVDGLGRTVWQGVPVKGRVAFGPLPPGYYSVLRQQHKLGCLVVTVPEADYPGDRDSCLGVDFAMASAPPLKGRDATLAMIERNLRLARLAGVRRIRERLPLVYKLQRRSDGTLVMKKWLTEYAFACARKAGMHITVMFQSLPPSFCQDRNSRKAVAEPADALELFRFLGRHYRGVFDCWEIYNEIDLFNFYEGTAADYASFFKVASLGLRQGDPACKVALSSFARTSRAMKDALAANALMPWYDVFNFHTYAESDSLFEYARTIIAGTQLTAGREIWCTEAGTHIGNGGASAGADHPAKVDAMLARQVIPVYTELLAAGVDRVYYFLWRFFPTVGSVLDRNYQATQRYAALATVNRMLGNARYRGSSPDRRVRVHLFDPGKGARPCLAAWSFHGEQPFSLEVRGGYEVVAMTGETIRRGTADGTLQLKLSGTPILVRAERFPGSWVDLRVRPAATSYAAPTPLVMAMKFDRPLKYDNALAASEASPGQEIEGRLTLSNFGPDPIRDRIVCSVGGGWSLTLEQPEFDLAPGAAISRPFRLLAPRGNHGKHLQRIGFRTAAGGAVLAADFALDYQYLKPSRVQPVFTGDELPRWVGEAYDRSTMKVDIRSGARPGDPAAFRVDFIAPAKNRMFWPYVSTFAGKRDLLDFSGWDGIRFTLKVKSIRPGTWFMCTLTERNGARYGSSRIVVDRPGTVELLYIFSYFVYVYQGSAPDGPDFHLNTEAIKRIALGFHTLKKYQNNLTENYTVDYEITAIDLVRY